MKCCYVSTHRNSVFRLCNAPTTCLVVKERLDYVIQMLNVTANITVKKNTNLVNNVCCTVFVQLGHLFSY
jgi:hypothetical protein